MAVTVDMVKNYLGIDLVDPMIEANLARLIPVADAYLKSAVGENYPKDDPKAEELSLILIADMYENRTTTSDKASNQIRRIVDDFALQLRLELARAAEVIE